MMRFDKRNSFNLSHEHKLTCDMGYLVPCLCMEGLPGDVIRLQSDFVLRLAPMLAPLMHNVNAYMHYFSVPTRLLLDNWESFITGGKNNDDNTVLPTINSGETGFEVGSLADYLGFPVNVPNLSVSAFPFRAYDLIYNTWYRDENLIDELDISTAEGVDTTTSTTLQRRAWRKGYFTNALPWPQRGESVYLPLGVEAPVVGNGMTLGMTDGTNNLGVTRTRINEVTNAGLAYDVYGDPLGSASANIGLNGAVSLGVTTDPEKSGLATDLSTATAVTVDALRSAVQLQLFANLVGRAGYRYVEYLKAFFGVTSSDARLQRPEYLGGFKAPIMISEVLQTSSTDATSPQGNMAGHGVSAQRSKIFTKTMEEHCIILGILSIMPKDGYQQGVNRSWLRKTRYDYYVPVLAHLGQQAVLNKELYAQGANVVNDDGEVVDELTFGYQDRYDEYRQMEDQVHGEFRTTLDFWTMNRKFDNLPALNQEFIECNPTKRPFAVTSEHCCIIDMYHRIKAIRPIPKFGDPGFMDHY